MSNEIVLIEEDDIKEKIYNIRDKQVMLDSDLAKLYRCTNGTKDINKAVKRNILRFPKDFYFQLTPKEYQNLKFQFGTSSLKTHGGVRKLPYVFTEQGVAMLASVLKTNKAAEVSVSIMRAFVAMRNILIGDYNYNNEINFINNKLLEHDIKINEIFDRFNKKNNKIFFEGEIYDAYSMLLNIFERISEELIIIDNYANKELLDIVSNYCNKVIIISKNIDEILIRKYNSQYNNVRFINNNSFHDRFIIIDRKEIYTIGSSIKDIGKKTTCINKIEDEKELNKILEKITFML